MDKQNNTLKTRLLSSENIYLAIYSLESYVKNTFLLSDRDNDRLQLLTDKYNEEYINKWIKKVRKRIEAVLADEYFQAEVFFKPKKYNKNSKNVKFRPIHTTTLVDYIAMVSMLNILIYEFDKNKKIIKSSMANLVPYNFYGNRISCEAGVLFKNWVGQYKEYTTGANECLKRYCETREYKYELTLDIKDFFPSINPVSLYGYLCGKIPVNYTNDEKNLLFKIIEKLLFVKLKKLQASDKTLYIEDKNWVKDIKFVIGLAQGLPQGYFFANLFMLKVKEIYDECFPGKKFFYVDDSVIFTNGIENVEKANEKIEEINKKINKYMDSIYNHPNNLTWRELNFTKSVKKYYIIEVYSISTGDEENNKSTLTNLFDISESEIFIHCISRETSKTSFDIRSTFSDEDIGTLSNKTSRILEVVNNEIKNIKKETQLGYREKLIRYRKFFKNRTLNLGYRNQFDCKEMIEKFKNDFLLEGDDEKKKEYFFEKYNEDVFEVALYMLLQAVSNDERDDSTDGNTRKEVIKELDYLNKLLFKYKNTISSYFYKMYTQKNYIKPRLLTYETLNQKSWNRMISLKHKTDEARYEEIKRNLSEKELSYYVNFFFGKDFIKTIDYVLKNSNEIQRHCINAFYSVLMGIDIDDELILKKYIDRRIKYYELRLLVYFRNKGIKFDQFDYFKKSCVKEEYNCSIDYSLIQVLNTFRAFVREATKVDNLILVHKYVCDIWKNGSKHLYFYTLHNQDHAVVLIDKSVTLVKSIDYIQLNHYDYYILFMACYLHDISMVTLPDLNIIKKDEAANNVLCSEFEENILSNEKEISSIMLDCYMKMDRYYESYVRNNHAFDSAREIRKREELNFISLADKDLIADISEAHGYSTRDVYHIKSKTDGKNIHIKFLKILLRLADLLDMCSNRVSLLILNHNLENMEKVSRFHWLSHFITMECGITSDYKIKENQRENFLKNRTIIETIIVKVKVALPQLTHLKSNKCSAMKLADVSGNILHLIPGEKCDGSLCNFLCKWFALKNNYLADELDALQKYLQSVRDNYFDTKIEIQLETVNESRLSEKQYSLLQEYLT